MYGDFEEEFRENIYTVSEVNGFVKETIECVPVFSGIRLRGEISNFTAHKSGHLYFSLKDENSVIKAVMFSRDCRQLTFRPNDGMKVVATGRLTVYPPSGVYQIVVSSMQPDGKGALYEAYEKLKQKLMAEGLFDAEYKKTLPKFPRVVGVITSPTGAAVRDIINVTGRRWPLAKILVYPALVQGEGSEASLIDGVRHFTERSCADVVIIGRGGGSIEDLWSFNSEALAREIVASHLPFISAVGHETDFTICDFACSLRAPTPSGAAELAVPDMLSVRAEINSLSASASREIIKLLSDLKNRLNYSAERRVIRSPYGFIDEKRLRLDTLSDKLQGRYELNLASKKDKFGKLCEKLDALSPLSVLTRGYGAVYSETGNVLTSISEVNSGDNIRVRFKDGTVGATVNSVTKTKNEGGFTDGGK